MRITTRWWYQRREAEKMYKKKDGVIVNYHGPYVDSSGEKFYLL